MRIEIACDEDPPARFKCVERHLGSGPASPSVPPCDGLINRRRRDPLGVGLGHGRVCSLDGGAEVAREDAGVLSEVSGGVSAKYA
jgi:hypothetical protein